MSKDNGGPAFPVEMYDADMDDDRVYPGMTLRDYFAAKALQGLVSCQWDTTAKNYALASYRLADAMLKERARHGGA